MLQDWKTATFVIMVTACLCLPFATKAGGIKNRHYHFSLSLPETMIQVASSPENKAGELYLDSATNLILLITRTESRFKSVDDYVDCSRSTLENELRICYDDTSLKLLSCSKSAFYPKKTVLLQIELSVLPSGYDECEIYFIHHRRKDIQFSFMFLKANAAPAINEVSKIMSSLALH